MKYSDILKNEHFQNLAANVQALYQPGWKCKHPGSKAATIVIGLDKIRTGNNFAHNRAEIVGQFSALLVDMAHADSELTYTEDDLTWFVESMDTPGARAILSLLFAYASAPVA